MKTKMKTWARVLLVCMVLSLFCAKSYSAETKKCRTERDQIELNILTKGTLLR